jgi:hypothetical protein
LQAEYGDKGLVVLALSDEEAEKVGAYVDEMGLTIRVGSGSDAGNAYQVKGLPTTAVIDASGKLAWMGHPSSLSNGTVEAALKGAKPRSSNFLALQPSREFAGKVEAQAKASAQGKIGKAHAALKALAADAKATEEEKSDAAALISEIETHVGALREQSERFVKALDLVKALMIQDALAKEFAGAEIGTQAKVRADEIEKDPKLSKELAAAEAFDKLRESVSKLASSKKRDKFKEFAEKYKGTRAAERARSAASAKS